MGRHALLAMTILCGGAVWAGGPPAAVNDKIGLYVTPAEAHTKQFPVEYPAAVATLRGFARTVWVLESWRNIETADGVYDWSSLDRRIDEAVRSGFDVGIRAQVVLCGNNAQGESVAVSRVPAFLDADMSSEDFQRKAPRFYGALAARYKGKARYIAVGNSVNQYFRRNEGQWEGFKKAYPAIVGAIRQADPKALVLSDLAYGGEFYEDKTKLQKYLDFFGEAPDDGFGFVFYFITRVYYGEFSNFTAGRLEEVLDEMHRRTRGKKIYLIETACFSTHPRTGADLSGVQARYVDMLLRTAVKKDYLLGLSWWQLYDARDEPDVPWDIRVGFGLFDSAGKAKPAWTTWKTLCTLPHAPATGAASSASAPRAPAP